MNNRLLTAINLQDALHGFRQGRGTRNGNHGVEVGPTVRETGSRTAFLGCTGCKKSYESLDIRRYMEILRGYVLGPNLQRLLQQYWYERAVLLKEKRIFG